MDCKVAISRLNDYLFGSLMGVDRQTLETHLQSCQSCLRIMIEMKRDIDIGAFESRRPSKQVFAKLMVEFDSLHAVDSQARRFNWFAISAVAAILIIATAFLFINREQGNRTSAQSSAETAQSNVSEELEVIDSGGMTPGHLNTL